MKLLLEAWLDYCHIFGGKLRSWGFFVKYMDEICTRFRPYREI
jgi:hypothetical protein